MNSCSVVVLVLCVVLFAKSLAGFGHPFFPIHDGDNGDSPPQIVGLFFSARWFCSSLGVQCNTVQSVCAILGVSAIHKIVWMRAQD